MIFNLSYIWIHYIEFCCRSKKPKSNLCHLHWWSTDWPRHRKRMTCRRIVGRMCKWPRRRPHFSRCWQWRPDNAGRRRPFEHRGKCSRLEKWRKRIWKKLGVCMRTRTRRLILDSRSYNARLNRKFWPQMALLVVLCYKRSKKVFMSRSSVSLFVSLVLVGERFSLPKQKLTIHTCMIFTHFQRNLWSNLDKKKIRFVYSVETVETGTT